MVDDWSDVALRLAVYVDLMLLFGVPLFAISALAAPERGGRVGRRCAAVAVAAAALGVVLALLSLVAMARQMAGTPDDAAVSGHVLQTILTRTGAGAAWAVRVAALALCLAAAGLLRGRAALRLTALAWGGAVALATLAWTGHGAMDEGARAILHLAVDVLHLLAAGAWVGALVAFVSLPASGGTASGGLETLRRTASGFARTGTAIVLTLTMTGTINYLLTVGPSLRALVASDYGRLLATKLGLFAAMLALAAANRYRLAPRLEAAMAGGEPRSAARALRRSLRCEAALACAVLALVAWLGLLSPDA